MFSPQTQNWRHPQWSYSSDVRVFLARRCMSLQMQFLAEVRSNLETSGIFEILLGVATLTGPFLMTIGTFLLLLQLVMHSQWVWITVLKKTISLRPSFLAWVLLVVWLWQWWYPSSVANCIIYTIHTWHLTLSEVPWYSKYPAKIAQTGVISQ